MLVTTISLNGHPVHLLRGGYFDVASVRSKFSHDLQIPAQGVTKTWARHLTLGMVIAKTTLCMHMKRC